MISFYAEAHDHTQEVRTALYFVDVRPFDKTYRESQEMAGGSVGGNGGLDFVFVNSGCPFKHYLLNSLGEFTRGGRFR